MHDIGMDTRDLGTLGVTHPAEQGLPAKETETSLRRTSLIWCITAAGILTVTTIGALAIGALTVEHGIESGIIRLLIILCVGIASNVASAFLAAFLVEYSQRQQRTLIRKAMTTADSNAGLLEQLVNRCNALVDQLAANNREIAAMRTQMKGFEAKVAAAPDYRDGFEDGARLGAAVLGPNSD